MSVSEGSRLFEPRPAIDPRFRARRIEVRRDEGRRRLQRLLEVGALAVVGLGFFLALRSPLLDVDEVVVAGSTRIAPEVVRDATGVGTGTQLVDVDVHEVGVRVAALPWVDEVTVARRVSGVVEVTVTERVPVARLVGPSGVLLVDREGRVLGPEADAPELAGALVALSGVGEGLVPGDHVPGTAGSLLQVATALGADLPGTVTALEVQREGDGAPEIRGQLAQGGVVRLGDARQLDAKLLALATVLEQVDTEGLGVLDLRLPGNPVLTRESS
ncbi:MAG: cell division protein FtsQ/DivIB [Acidimicrobiia bacterium]